MKKACLIKALILMMLMSSVSYGATPAGPLSVMGNKIVNSSGQPVSFAGMSFFWSNDGWGGMDYYNADCVNWLVSDWEVTILRAAMGVEDSGGYIDSPTNNKNRVITVVDAAIAAGIYVIIDWHSHHAENNQSAAISFFQEMATTYGGYDNVIYEIYNEPWGSKSWSGTVKPYSEAVIAAIRAIDPDNLIIVGSPEWSQRVDLCAADPITGYINLAYTVHFYPDMGHTQWLRDRCTDAMNSGIALMATEWGDGSPGSEVDIWMDYLEAHSISHCNWAVNDKDESLSCLKPEIGLYTGGWTANDLTASGTEARSICRGWPEPPPPPPPALKAVYQESGGECVMEAEYATVSQRTDNINLYFHTEKSGYVGEGYMTTPDNTGLSTTWSSGCELAWDVEISTAGTYYMAVRRIAPDNGDDSAKVGVNGFQKDDKTFTGEATSWQWSRGTDFDLGTLSAGTHTIQIRRREDGFCIDRVMIADSWSKLPSDGSTEAGPDQSPFVIPGPYQESNGECTMEAENATVDQRFDVINWYSEIGYSGYAGNGYMTTQGDPDNKPDWSVGCEMAWDVEISTPGTYYMALRRLAPSDNDDSAKAGVDGIERDGRTFEDSTGSEWKWSRGTDFDLGNLSAGTHTIQIRRREDGFCIDRVMIADSWSKLPADGSTEVGPVESPAPPDTTPPAAPTGLSATAGDATVSLDWNDNSEPDLAGYDVYRSTTTGGPYNVIAFDQTSSDYTDNSVSNGTTYYYVVTAVDTFLNESGYSNEDSATPSNTTPPAAPTGLWATAGDATVWLDWSDNGEADLDGYNVYRSTTPGGGYTQLNGSLLSTSDYTDNSASNGTTYYYVVTAVDTFSNESGYSNEDLATPSSGGVEGVYQEADGKCTMETENATVDQRSDSINWYLDTGYSGYAGSGYMTTQGAGDQPEWSVGCEMAWDVEISTPGTYYMAVRRLAPSDSDDSARAGVDGVQRDDRTFEYSTGSEWKWSRGTDFDLGNLSAGRHTIQIRRREDGFCIDRVMIADSLSKLPADGSTEAGAPENPTGSEPPDTTPPAAPTGLSATAGDATVSLDWNDNGEGDLDGYNIYRSTTSGSGYTQLNVSLLSTSDYTDNSVTNGTTYYYVVTAVDTSNNESGYSGEVSATPQGAPPNAMHVADIAMSIKTTGKNINGVATVTVVDASGVPVEGATVSGHWSGLTSDSDSGITLADGTVSLNSNKLKNPSGTFTFTVDGITKTGWTYDSGANVETSDSITVP